MIASAEWKQGTRFDGHSDSGHTIHFDTDAAHTAGPSPMEAVLAALCGCTSVDVVSILEKKRQPITGLVVSADAQQAPAPPRIFTHIKLTYRVSGKLSRKAVEDAVALSKNKYCSVSKMLEKSATIEFVIEYADGEPAE
jgi:putative redox protein